MKLSEASQNLHALADCLDDVRQAHDGLAFCVNVFRAYDSGSQAPNEHMDPAKAKAQLLDAIDRAVKTTRD